MLGMVDFSGFGGWVSGRRMGRLRCWFSACGLDGLQDGVVIRHNEGRGDEAVPAPKPQPKSELD